VGGRESAVDFMVTNAAKTFTFENGNVTSKEFSATKPGEPLTVTEWISQQVQTADFAFKNSKGGGTPPGSGSHRLGVTSKAKELRNPTPQQLGQSMGDIASGKLKIVYTE
jgi:hypothetical protein